MNFDIKDFIPGCSFKVFYGQDNPNNRTYHIRGIVDDYIICRSWNKHKKQWCYELYSPFLIEFLIKEGAIKRLKKGE